MHPPKVQKKPTPLGEAIPNGVDPGQSDVRTRALEDRWRGDPGAGVRQVEANCLALKLLVGLRDLSHPCRAIEVKSRIQNPNGKCFLRFLAQEVGLGGLGPGITLQGFPSAPRRA